MNANNVMWYYIAPCLDLSKLYKLLRNIPRGLQAMVAELEEHITKTGNIVSFVFCVDFINSSIIKVE